MGAFAFAAAVVLGLMSTAALVDTCEAEVAVVLDLGKKTLRVVKAAGMTCALGTADPCRHAVSNASGQLGTMLKGVEYLRDVCGMMSPGLIQNPPSCLEHITDVNEIVNATSAVMHDAVGICGPASAALRCEYYNGVAYANLNRGIYLMNNFVVKECS